MNFPVGYYQFNKDEFINYQLNRWYSLGCARKKDLENVGANIRSFSDYIREFTRASELALKEDRLKHAATYLRAAEFLIPPDDERKIPTYNKYRQLFERAFASETFKRHKIPYNDSYLSTIKIPSKTNEVKATVIGIPGFDAFIEELYSIWDYFTHHGYDFIAFEGPGQGGSRRIYGQTFDHDYEKPTAAVLDYFELQSVTAMGVSMGGYWIMRTAAFEKRIKKVIAMPPVYDWLELTNTFNQCLVKWIIKYRSLMNFFIRLKMNVGKLKHTIKNALFIQDKSEPIEAVEWMLGMNKEHLNSQLITQDVLLLTGENDAFQPSVLLKKQKEALVNAASVTQRIFLESEQADQHCQMGNLELALETILKWMNERSN